MQDLNRPAAGTASAGLPAEPVDQLLTAYFRAALPEPWPDLAPPSTSLQPLAASSRRAQSRSRLVLAASVALLLGGGVYLTQRFPQSVVSDTPDGPGLLSGSRRLPRTPLKTSRPEVPPPAEDPDLLPEGREARPRPR